MISVYLTCYVLTTISVVIAHLRYKAGYLHYPFWVALTFTGFAMPQVISLARTGAYPGQSLEKYVVMASLCLGATHFGFMCGSRATLGARLRRLFLRRTYVHRLRGLAFFYIVLGAVFLGCLYLSGVQFANQYWEGPVVIYIFFGGFMAYGFVIAADLYLQTGDALDLVLALCGATYLLLRTVVHGRRSSALLLVIILLGLLWFRRRKRVPVWSVFGVVVAGLVISASMHAYRLAVADRLEFSELADIAFIETFIGSFREGQACEVTNACYAIEATDRTRLFDYGTYNWNAAVWAFVPRQLVGTDFKQGLMLPFDVEENTYRVFGYMKKTGSTLTGIADCYIALFYAGCVKFFLIAFTLGVLYTNAGRGSVLAIVLYLLLLPKGLTSFTHGTHEFSNALILFAVLIVPGIVFSQTKRGFAVQVRPFTRRSIPRDLVRIGQEGRG